MDHQPAAPPPGPCHVSAPHPAAGHRGLSVLTNFRRRSKDTQPPSRPQAAPGIPRPLPKQLDHLRSSQYRPPSSVYSQPSPLQSQFVPATSVNVRNVSTQRIADDNNVSPPSSPEALTPNYDSHRQLSPDISPVDEVPDMSQLDSNRGGSRPESSQGRTNIPTMRRERRRHHDQTATHLREINSGEKPREKAQSQSNTKPNPQLSRLHSDPRWDPMTGELTTSILGKPSQVKPIEYAQGLGITNNQKNPKSPTSFGERVRRKMPGSSRPEPIESRPAWNGASGRTTLVEPVQDFSDVPPLRIPVKSTKRSMTRLGSISPPVSPETGPYATTIDGRTDGKTLRGPSSPATHTGAQAYPSPPNSGKPLNAPNAQSQPDNAGTRAGAAATPPPQSPRHRQLFQRAQQQLKGHHQQQSSSDVPAPVSVPSTTAAASSTTTAALPAPHPLPPLPAANPSLPPRAVEQSNADSWAQPPSRFSVTTYAPSTTESPRPSQDDEAPPMPTSSQKFTSVLERSRPKVGGDTIGAKPPSHRKMDADPIVVSLKSPAFVASPTKTGPLRSNPVLDGSRSRTWDTEARGGKESVMMTGALEAIPSTASAYPSAAAFSSAFRERRLSSSSTNKDLPPAPPEMEGNSNGDRVAVLNAKLAALCNRRININRSIKQMTELMPADNLMASAAVLVKREEEKKKVEVLKLELADVQREEYELGLKLHRAYKRMDREANYESTTLWVRRATHD